MTSRASSRPRSHQRIARAAAITTAAITAVAIVGWSAEARGCKPWIPLPTALVGPVVPGAALRVSRQILGLDCRAEAGGRWWDGTLRCDLRAAYQVHNDGPAPITGRGGVLVERGDHLAVRRGGVDISAPTTAAERTEWIESIMGPLAWYRDDDDGASELRTFDAAIDAGSTVEWVIEAEVVIELSASACALPPIFARHGGQEPAPTFSTFIYRPHLGRDAPLEVDLDLPRPFAVDEWGAISPRAFKVTASGRGRRRHRARLDDLDMVSLSFSRHVRFVPGGPIVAAGLDLGAGARPRLRVGWELATLRRWWIQSLAVESDLRTLALVPTTEVATRVHLWVIPSVGLGLGAPLRIYPEVRAGVRAQLTLGWRWFSLVGALDVYPVRGGRDELRGGLMIQTGL